MKKRDAGDKHAEVTGASLLRRAKGHGAKAKERKGLAKLNGGNQWGMIHRAVAEMHLDSAKILRGEAKEIRGQR